MFGLNKLDRPWLHINNNNNNKYTFKKFTHFKITQKYIFDHTIRFSHVIIL